MTEIVPTNERPAPLGPTGMPLIPPTPEAAREAMRVYQEISRALIDPAEDIQRIGRNEFPKRSAFQKLGNAYRVSTQIVKDVVDYDDAGNLLRARITVRATHPDGRFTEGDGTCAATERKGDAKLEHDVHGTAVTRAKNRAISDLVAFGVVSAEEVDADGGEQTAGPAGAPPPWARHVDDVGTVAAQLVAILKTAGDEDAADTTTAIGQAIFDTCDGGIPDCVARLVEHLHGVLVAPIADPTSDPSSPVTPAEARAT